MKEVHEIAPDDKYPDCVFVEDPVTVCEDTAFLTKLGQPLLKYITLLICT